MNYLFISYSRKDEAFVSHIADKLEKNGVKIWQDISGKSYGIPNSVKWFDAIREAIFEAAGSLIFISEQWKTSKPCSDEYELIQKTKQPFKTIVVDEWRDMDLLANELTEWYNKEIACEELDERSWLMAGAYRILYCRKPSFVFPKAKTIVSTFKLLSDYRDVNEYIDETFSEEADSDIRLAAKKYLSMAKKAAVMSIIKRVGLAVFIVTGFLSACLGFQTLQEFSKITETSTTNLTALSKVNRMADYDPIDAMSILTTPQIKNDNGKQRILINTLTNHFPSDFLSGQEASRLVNTLKSNKNGKVNVVPSSTDGIVHIADKGNGIQRQLPIDGILTDYAFDTGGTVLALASGKNVYITDTMHSLYCAKMTYNFEDVQSVFVDDKKVYAYTVNKNMVVWDIPFIHATSVGLNVADGKIVEGASQDPVAILTDNNRILIRRENGETKDIFREPNGTVNRIAVSSDGKRFAAATSQTDGDDCIVFSSFDDTSTIETVLIEGVRISDLCFDGSGETVVAVGYDGDIITVNLSAKTYSKKTSCFPMLSRIIRYQDGFIVSDVNSELYRIDKMLNIEALNVNANSFYVPLKNMVVSDKTSCLFSASKTGNSLGGNLSLNLNNGAINYFAPPDNIPFVATDELALSHDESVVAFSYSDGKISFWEADTLHLLWISDEICEKLVSLRFSDDDKYLYAIGKSGMLYRIKIHNAVNTEIDSTEKQIAILSKEAKNTYTKMERFKLTYITPDAYDSWDNQQNPLKQKRRTHR